MKYPYECDQVPYHSFVRKSGRNDVVPGIEGSKIPNMSLGLLLSVVTMCAHRLQQTKDIGSAGPIVASFGANITRQTSLNDDAILNRVA